MNTAPRIDRALEARVRAARRVLRIQPPGEAFHVVPAARRMIAGTVVERTAERGEKR